MKTQIGAAVVLVVGLACGGCAAATDKAGGDADAITLTFANPYSHLTYVPQVDSFLDAVERASGGTIAIELVNEWRGAPGSEKGTIDDVANGAVDLAWVGTRAFDLTGETALQALTAPLLVDSNELQQAIIDSDLPARMIDAVHIDGVETLAILAGGLRRPFSVDGPLTNPSSFEGISFQAFESALSSETVRALGAQPTNSGSVTDGSFTGFEKQFSTVMLNGTNVEAPYVAANVILWPETIALVGSAERLGKLTDRQRAWIEQAAAEAAHNSVHKLPADVANLAAFCAGGGRAGLASASDLAAFRAAVEPVYQRLREDPITAGFLADIDAIKAATASTELAVPAGCTGVAVSASAVQASPDAAADAIDGVYRWELTAADADAAGQREDPRYPLPHVFTMTLADGRWSHHVRDAKQEADYGGGRFTVQGQRLTLIWDHGGSMEFTFDVLPGGNLRVLPTASLIAEDAFVMTTHEWVRIG